MGLEGARRMEDVESGALRQAATGFFAEEPRLTVVKLDEVERVYK